MIGPQNFMTFVAVKRGAPETSDEQPSEVISFGSNTIFTEAARPRRSSSRQPSVIDGGFLRRADAEQRISSAKKAIVALLDMDLHDAVKKGLIKEAIWYLSEAEGVHKHKTRYRTQGAINSSEKLQHEHVMPMRCLIEDLINDPASADNILQQVVACTVTKSEHTRLTAITKSNPNLKGWQRYAAAGIVVIDTVTEEELNLG